MKKIGCVVTVLCMLFSMTGRSHVLSGAFLLFLIGVNDNRTDKEDIFAFVREREEELLQVIECGDFSAFENKGFIGDIQASGTCIDFSRGGAGIGSGTSYVGFFYTPDNDITAVWCAGGPLTPSGDGYAWQQEDGDNRYYTEHICGNFYYYEASF